ARRESFELFAPCETDTSPLRDHGPRFLRWCSAARFVALWTCRYPTPIRSAPLLSCYSSDRIYASQEDVQPSLPGQQSIDDASAREDQLARQPDEVVEEGLELHRQHGRLLRRVLLAPSTRLGPQESEPCLERQHTRR